MKIKYFTPRTLVKSKDFTKINKLHITGGYFSLLYDNWENESDLNSFSIAVGYVDNIPMAISIVEKSPDHNYVMAYTKRKYRRKGCAKKLVKFLVKNGKLSKTKRVEYYNDPMKKICTQLKLNVSPNWSYPN